MPRVSAPRLISDAKKPAAAPALDAAVEAAGASTSTPARRTRKTPQSGRSGAGTRRTTSTKGKASGKRQEPTEPAGEGPGRPAVETEQPATGGDSRRTARPEFPDQPDGIPGEKRISLPLWQHLWRALSLARLDDGVDTTVRIRSMIELWEHDPRVRAKVDKLALQRASTMHRGRPRKS